MLNRIISTIPPSWMFFSLSAVLLIFCFSRKNNNFFNVRSIFSQHFAIFNGNKFQIFIFCAVPLFLALGTLKVKIIDKDIINNINIVQSILISMFFAMISILYGISIKTDSQRPDKIRLLNETVSTIMFECTLSILLLIISFVVLFADSYCLSWPIFVTSLIIYYLLFTITLNVFIIIKRLQKLFKDTSL